MLFIKSNKALCFVFFVFFCCKPKVSFKNKCIRNKELIEFEAKRGNFYYNSSLRFNQIQEYYLYEKYDIISIYEFGLLTKINDSCFDSYRLKTIKEKGINLKKIKSELDSIIHYSETSLKEDSLKIKKFHDGYYLNAGKNGKSYCKVKYPNNDYEEFQKFLLDKIQKLDSTFVRSSCYLEVDKLGNVISVRIKKKNNKKIDSLLKSELLKSKWTPTINTFGDTLRVRKYFSL